ncbi:MAG TPA: hypothetical protein DEA08_07050 [Planctomycetes bacterium]|nr:hypothetical protein [Planctomycetota bacterium]
MKPFLALTFALLLSLPTSAQDEVVHLRDYDVSGLNEGLVANRLTCDLHFHLTKKGHVKWATVVERLPELRRIFEPAGVQLRVASARLIEIPAAWHSLKPHRGDPPAKEATTFYGKYGASSRLAPATERVFRGVIGKEGPGAVSSVHFVSIRKVDTGWWERGSDGAWRYETAGTSACSFPPYMFADRIPARLRGVITLSSGSAASRTLAHELGHKLINVSHEGVGRDPQGEQWGPDDLMIYGRGTRIPAGAEGRFQRERLQKSPFLYRTVAGERRFNPPYKEGGHYWDPIYAGLWAEEPPKRERARVQQGMADRLPSDAEPDHASPRGGPR